MHAYYTLSKSNGFQLEVIPNSGILKPITCSAEAVQYQLAVTIVRIQCFSVMLS
jgi:hypothetical protein